jgi:NAD(P)-dependent dehydrogenase (short-subunit alcohol dehydrogenase family)
MKGTSVIVTGAASGIGRAIAQRLADAGADVLAVDLEPDEDGPGVAHAADLTTRASAGSTRSCPTPASSTWRRSASSPRTAGTG